MPTYEFRCSNGHRFEQMHKISDAPSTATCPECGLVAERAISGGAGLVFKGSGFYLTDYGKNAHRGGTPSKPSEGGESSTSSTSNKADAPSTPAPAPAPTSTGGGDGSKGAA